MIVIRASIGAIKVSIGAIRAGIGVFKANAGAIRKNICDQESFIICIGLNIISVEGTFLCC